LQDFLLSDNVNLNSLDQGIQKLKKRIIESYSPC
jgi:hypothetical protein